MSGQDDRRSKLRERTLKAWRRLNERSVRPLQPDLPFDESSLREMLLGVIDQCFPDRSRPAPALYFAELPTLGFITGGRTDHPVIWLHRCLNDPVTPRYVFSHILKHEMLHTQIPPREVDGVCCMHPPEFWEAEARISEERRAAWDWIGKAFGILLLSDRDYQCIWVNKKEMRSFLRYRHSVEAEVKHIIESSNLAFGELRFGFRDKALADRRSERWSY